MYRYVTQSLSWDLDACYVILEIASVTAWPSLFFTSRTLKKKAFCSQLDVTLCPRPSHGTAKHWVMQGNLLCFGALLCKHQGELQLPYLPDHLKQWQRCCRSRICSSPKWINCKPTLVWLMWMKDVHGFHNFWAFFFETLSFKMRRQKRKRKHTEASLVSTVQFGFKSTKQTSVKL